jgi:arsenite methyltransferase
VAGALEDSEYRLKLLNAGFETVELETTRVYRAEDAAGYPLHDGESIEASAMDGKFISAFIRARKPLGA